MAALKNLTVGRLGGIGLVVESLGLSGVGIFFYLPTYNYSIGLREKAEEHMPQEILWRENPCKTPTVARKPLKLLNPVLNPTIDAPTLRGSWSSWGGTGSRALGPIQEC